MRKFSKKQLEAKVAKFNQDLASPFLTKSEKIRITSAISYYINKLAQLDENPTLNKITA